MRDVLHNRGRCVTPNFFEIVSYRFLDYYFPYYCEIIDTLSTYTSAVWCLLRFLFLINKMNVQININDIMYALNCMNTEH